MKKARELAWSRTLVTAGERVCVGVSGGADSVALLLALHEANDSERAKEPLGIVLSAVHVHHGIRAEADQDKAFVRELCARLRVPLVIERVDVAARRAEEHEGMEEAARELRYQVFRRLMGEGRADVVATAHTLDDQAETVMMKLLRGAWTEGIGGIAPVVGADVLHTHVSESRRGAPGPSHGRIVRPMLGVRRAEVEVFLHERGQSWREDATNRDLSLTRNRVRHELMPVLRGFNPEVDRSLARLAEIARDEEAFWKAEVARVLPQVVLLGKAVRGGGRAVSTAAAGAQTGDFGIELERLRPLPEALRRRVLRAAVRGLGVRLSAEETAKALALGGMSGAAEAKGHGVKGKIGSRLELRDGLRVERTARELRFSITGR